MQKPLNLTAKKIIKKRQAPQFFYKKMPTKKVKTAKKKYRPTRKKPPRTLDNPPTPNQKKFKTQE